MGLGPVHAISELINRSDRKLEQFSAIEINEAFAVQVLACVKQLKEHGMEIPKNRLNPRGGSIALGHPVGATGARLTGSLIH